MYEETRVRGTHSLLVNHDRVFYDGLLGKPHVRVLGSHTIYAATEGDVTLTLSDGVTLIAPAVSVAPYTPHKVSTANRLIRCLMIEPERVSLPDLPAFLHLGQDDFARFDWGQHLQKLSFELRVEPTFGGLSMRDFDLRVFGLVLPHRELDARISGIVGLIREVPAGAHSAEDCAAQCHLSTSRFMHLFKSECGVSFRTFKTWKRARSLLNVVTSGNNLTTVAYELGYSDSAYFSNSIRHFTGLRPKDIMVGSRHMRLLSTT
jgi:AraC-like DNA-binding protein